MKPTSTINLNGLVFYIDDDAYQTLHTYLNNVRKQIGDSDDNEEIMHDVEARIAELFTDMLKHKGIQVINNFMVGQVMEQLGKPEDFAQENETVSSDNPETDNKNTDDLPKRRHRLYLDPDNALLAGVCSGIAAYLGWDVVWVRLLFVLCTFLWGITIPIYLLIWIIAPAARTAAQRLEMRGEIASIDNIKKEYERAAQYAEEHQVAARTKSVFRTFLRILLFIVGICVLLPLLGFIALMLFILFFAGIAMFEGLFTVPSEVIGWLPDLTCNPVLLSHPGLLILTAFLLLLFCAIPLFIGIYWLVKYIRTHRHPSSLFWIITLVLWFASLIGLAAVTIHLGKHLATDCLPGIVQQAEPDFANCTDTVSVMPFTAIEIEGAVNLQIAQADTHSICIPSSAIPTVSANVEDGVLYLYGLSDHDMPSVRVTLPQWNACSIEGMSKIYTDGIIETDNLHISIEGASSLDAHLDVRVLHLAIEGIGHCRLQGNADTFHLSQEGASVVDAKDLVARLVNISCEGAASAEINCTQQLTAEAEGMSKIVYWGNPATCTIQPDITSTITKK